MPILLMKTFRFREVIQFSKEMVVLEFKHKRLKPKLNNLNRMLYY